MHKAKSFAESLPRGLVVAAALAGLIVLGGLALRAALADPSSHYYLPPNSQTVSRGFFPRNAPPALPVPSGAIVRIDPLSHQGLNNRLNCTPASGDLT